MENPFKFVSLVDTPYFTDRVKEVDYIVQFLKSENHLVLMSPRRFGKSSLVKKAVVQTQRPYLWLNMQAVLSKEDFAAKLLKEEMERITPPPVAGIPVSFSVPLLVEANAARTWAEAH